MKIKAVIYTRFSTNRQQSTQSQIAKCLEYAKNNDLEIVAIYSDEGTTGSNTDRYNFNALLDDAKKRKFEAVLIYDISRGSRDVVDWFNFRKDMEYLNINVISVTQHLGKITNSNDFLIELITVGLGQHANLQTREKSIDGKKIKAMQGLFQGGVAPLGYKIVNQKYVIDHYEAKIVKLIFEMYSNAYSYSQIIDKIKELGYKGRHGSIGKSTLYSVLTNDRYIGVFSWNRNINKIMNKWIGSKDNPNKVEIEGIIPPIISREIWNKTRIRIMDNKQNASFKAKEEYLLSGMIICDKCGAKYVGHTSTNKKGTRTRYYVCGNKYRCRTCNNTNINADGIEVDMVAYLRNWIKTEDLENYVNEVVSGINSTNKENTDDLTNELVGLNNKIARATKILLEDDIESIRDELIKMQTRKSEIKDILSQRKEKKLVNLDKEKLLERLIEDRDNLENISNKELVKKYINEIHHLEGCISVLGGCTYDCVTQTKSILL